MAVEASGLCVGSSEVRLALRRWIEALALRPLLWSLPFVVLGCLLGRAWAEKIQAPSPQDAALLAPALLGPLGLALKYLQARNARVPGQAQKPWPTANWSAIGLTCFGLMGLMTAHAARRWTPSGDDIARLLSSQESRLQHLQPVSGHVVARVLEVHRGQRSDFALLDLVPSAATSSQLRSAWGRVWARLPHPKFKTPPQVLAVSQVGAGDWVRARIELRLPRAPGAPWEKDDRLFALIRGAWCQGEVKGLEAVAPSRAGLAWGEINGLLDAARSRIAWKFEHGFAELKVPYARQSARLATAMAFGEGGLSEPLPDELRQAFRRAGVSHVLVASGAQVALVCALLWSLARVLCAPVRQEAWRNVLVALLIVPALIFYALLVGGAASIWRATLIGLGALLVQARGRRLDALSMWCGALSLLLICDPASLYDLSLQLSFGAAWGLIAFSHTLQSLLAAPLSSLQPESRLEADSVEEVGFVARWKHCALSLEEWKRGLRRLAWLGLRGACAVAGVSLAAHVGTLPVLLYSFGTLSLGSLCANLPIVPLSALLVASGSASLLLPLAWLHRFNYALADGTTRLVGVVASWRSAWLEAPTLSLAWTGLIAVLALAASVASWWPILLFAHRTIQHEEDDEEAGSEHDAPRAPSRKERALLWQATAQAAHEAVVGITNGSRLR